MELRTSYARQDDKRKTDVLRIICISFVLLKNFVDWERDYLVPTFEDGFATAVTRTPTCSELAVLSFCLLLEVKVLVIDIDTDLLRTDEDVLFPDPIGRVWDGHSERITLSSLLTTLGVPKDKRDFIDR